MAGFVGKKDKSWSRKTAWQKLWTTLPPPPQKKKKKKKLTLVERTTVPVLEEAGCIRQLCYLAKLNCAIIT